MLIGNGIFCEQQADGGVKLIVRESDSPESRILKETLVDQHGWASVIANMSFYGEEDYGYYRALNFHSGTPIHPTNPLVDKPAKWPTK